MGPGGNMQRTVIRQVEVPYTRQVKVPVKTKKVRPTFVKTRVPVTRLVERPSYKVVEETYTDYVEEPGMREKEVWVKKVVQEPYTRKVPVQRVREVKVPSTEFEKVQEWEEVEVRGDEIVEEDEYRIDTVEDTKMVEVEELQTYTFKPEPAGDPEIIRQRDLSHVNANHRSRNMGSEYFNARNPRGNQYPTDAYPNSYKKRRPKTSQSHKGRGRSSRNTHSHHYAQDDSSQGAPKSGKIGLKLNNTSQSGVLVQGVAPNSGAEYAGIRKGDIIVRVNNKVVRSLSEFRSVMNLAHHGPVVMEAVRMGGFKVVATIFR